MFNNNVDDDDDEHDDDDDDQSINQFSFIKNKLTSTQLMH